MAKFNEVQKRKRAQNAERKRAVHGDPSTGKLKNKPQPLSISGKRKRKLLKKWRRVRLFSLCFYNLYLVLVLVPACSIKISLNYHIYICWIVWLIIWFQDQNEAVEKGLITMQDVEMAAADGTFDFFQ